MNDYVECTTDQANARIYTTAGRGMAAARRMIPRTWWHRVVEVTIGRFVIDTQAGYIASRKRQPNGEIR